MSRRRHQAASFWVRYAGSIAFVVLLLISGLGFARIENARYDGCEGGNLLRAGLQDAERESIEDAESVDPALFPDIPPDLFEELLEEGIEDSRRRIRVNFAERDCGTKIDLPLTGASIVLPP